MSLCSVPLKTFKYNTSPSHLGYIVYHNCGKWEQWYKKDVRVKHSLYAIHVNLCVYHILQGNIQIFYSSFLSHIHEIISVASIDDWYAAPLLMYLYIDFMTQCFSSFLHTMIVPYSYYEYDEYHFWADIMIFCFLWICIIDLSA